MAKRERKRTPFDVDAALVKATKLFRVHGYRETSIQDIVDGTGISRAKLYETFADKHGLSLTVLTRYKQDYAPRTPCGIGPNRVATKGDRGRFRHYRG